MIRLLGKYEDLIHYGQGHIFSMVQSSLKYLSSKTIFVNADILILYYKISIFAFMKMLLSEDT